MLRIDPHTHSLCSDGTDTPVELMHLAAQAGLDMIALTDHDTFAGWDEAMGAVGDSGVQLIRGAEISCAAEGITVHLLAYLPDPSEGSLKECFAQTVQSRVTRAQRMTDNLSADFPITWEDVQRFAPKDGPIGRPHIADALVAAGIFLDRSAAFASVLHPSSPYYVHHWAPDPVNAVERVIRSGGVPVLAHPRARKRQRLLPESVIADMAEAGLFGIERDHRDHSESDRQDVDRIASNLKLRIFGSSDYHGNGKPNRLGEHMTDPLVIEELIERGALEVVRP